MLPRSSFSSGSFFLRLVALGVLLAVFPATVLVPTAQGQVLVQVREVTPEPGAASQLEAALEQHARWRRAHGDPWRWDVYEVVQGEDHGTYILRSTGHAWSDFDRYGNGFGQEAEQHWQATVAPMVASTETYVTERDTSLTHLPDDLSEYDLFDVYTYRIKPGHRGEFVEAYGKGFEAITQETDDRYYAMLRVRNGAHQGDTRVVVPRAGWADFETPDPTRSEIIREVYGQEEARQAYDQLNGAYRAYENLVARYRPGLSVDAQE
jgi:hypothetical protein